MRIVLAATIAAIVIVNAASAQVVPAQTDSATYWGFVSRALAGDTIGDYLELRFAAGRLKPAGPLKVSVALSRVRSAPDHAAARAVVDSAIRYSFAWVPAHNAAADSLAARGDSVRAQFHRAVARGLLASMEADRVRPGSEGIRVLSVAEEYVYMRSRGLEMVRQSLGRCQEFDCDRIDALDKNTQKMETLVFLLTWRKRGP